MSAHDSHVMDLIVIMNERIRHQTAEQRAAMNRFVAVSLVAVACLVISVYLSLPVNTEAETLVIPEFSGGTTRPAYYTAPQPTVSLRPTALALLLGAVGNVALVAGMNIAVQGAARQTALRRAAHFWIPSRDSLVGAPPSANSQGSVWLFAGYVLATLVVCFSMLARGAVWVCVVALIVQLATYFVRCNAWRQSPLG